MTVVDCTPARTPAVEESVALTLLARSIFDSAPEECRRLIQEYFFRERSYEEIAAATGWPIGTVKSRLARCLARAARRLRYRSGRASPRPGGGTGDVA
jgi:RNA polymerase sigma-70 factor (ECF subfamily)